MFYLIVFWTYVHNFLYSYWQPWLKVPTQRYLNYDGNFSLCDADQEAGLGSFFQFTPVSFDVQGKNEIPSGVYVSVGHVQSGGLVYGDSQNIRARQPHVYTMNKPDDALAQRMSSIQWDHASLMNPG